MALSTKPKFVTLHRTDGSEIAVNREYVYLIRPPHKNEHGNAVLIISALAQQIRETVDEARTLLESGE